CIRDSYDPELDRKLALKLLRTASTERRAERRRLRLIREAQAMARLSHAHVITVHDVGTIDDQVFVAMEFIEGCSLAEWIRMDHGWRRIVEIFLQAGEGLAAAHAAGLVHRDFKPDNVMLTAEFRAVVTDFGLARAATRRDASESREPDVLGNPSRASLSTTVTAVGAIMGTPAYMSPEQHEGREVDARSDQFAFAVALHEALFGVRPFPGDDVASLAYNVGVGNIRPAPSRTNVPGWVRQVLLKALSVGPSERYPTMVEMLEALRREGSGKRSWRWPTATVVGVMAVAGTLGVLLDDGDDPCAGGAAQLEAVLGPDAREPVRAVFANSPLPFAPDGWTAVDATLTGYAETWLVAHTEVCDARSTAPAMLYASRAACLERRLGDVDAMLTVLAQGDPRALQRGLEAVSELPFPDRCLTAPAASASSAAASLYGDLARVAALQRAGLDDEGLQAARELVERTSITQDLGLQAEARVRLASLQRNASRLELAEFNFKEALGLALQSGNDPFAADAAVALVDIIGADRNRTREAEGWAGIATALQERAGASVTERVALLVARAQLLEVSGRLDAARRPLQEAAQRLEDAFGQQDARVASAWASMGYRALRARDPSTAGPLFERALGVTQSALGPVHPRTASLMHAVGEVALLEGNLEEAAESLQAALLVRNQVADPKPRAETMLLQAFVDMARGDLDAAEETLLTVGALDGLSATMRGHAAVEFARLALRRGDAQGAIRAARSSRTVLGGPQTQGERLGLDAVTAGALLRQGHVREAEILIDDTIAALERGEGDAVAALAEPLTVRGELLLERALPARALGDLERALALRTALDTYGTARTEFALAQALVAVDPESSRAEELARQALGRLSAQEPLHTAAQRWLDGV
ncbi:MAG: serine/threonine-protein kinase, partial [Nannocystaceae bacterium]|nr:serine/threonine-protein kinase [Nannocystaceae bacterium]